MHKSIKFGSDGWRGVLARDFNFETLTCICDALFTMISENPLQKAPSILVGFDRRFMADIFAHSFARLWTDLGGNAEVASTFLPSPVLAWYTRDRAFDMGVMLTASHNPPQYLGVKLKDNFGASAHPEIQKKMSVLASNSMIVERSLENGIHSALDFDPLYRHRQSFDVNERYPECVIKEFTGLNLEKSPHQLPKIIVDFMNGAASELATRVFDTLGIDYEEMRSEHDPTFGGTGPEPKEGKLTALRERVTRAGGRAVGIAFDGDGDRLTAVDESGEVLLSSELFTIHLRHLVNERREHGRAIGTISFSTIVDRAAKDLGIELVKVPVGFKSVAAEFRNGNVLIGGEESGGTGFNFWLPERDALVMALVLFEAIAANGGKLKNMRDELYMLYGRLYFKSANVPLARLFTYNELDAALQSGNIPFLNRQPCSVDDEDGRKLVFADGSWMLIRLSGTEPLVRLYAESGIESDAIELLKSAEVFIKRLISL